MELDMQDPPTEDAVPDSALYSALSSTRRRYALHYLKQQNGPVPVRDLAEQVAAWEYAKSIPELTSKERKRVYISFYQSHLSTMAKQGLVTYDEQSGLVELSDPMATVDLYLEVVPKATVPWSLYYAGLSIANGIILLLAWFEFGFFAAVPPLAWGGLVLVSFALSAFVQLYYSRQMRIGDEGPPPELRSHS